MVVVAGHGNGSWLCFVVAIVVVDHGDGPWLCFVVVVVVHGY